MKSRWTTLTRLGAIGSALCVSWTAGAQDPPQAPRGGVPAAGGAPIAQVAREAPVAAPAPLELQHEAGPDVLPSKQAPFAHPGQEAGDDRATAQPLPARGPSARAGPVRDDRPPTQPSISRAARHGGGTGRTNSVGPDARGDGGARGCTRCRCGAGGVAAPGAEAPPARPCRECGSDGPRAERVRHGGRGPPAPGSVGDWERPPKRSP